LDVPETDMEGETGGEGITEQRKMVHSYFVFIFIFAKFLLIFVFIFLFSACNVEE
jgi:hypothetical protein